MAHYISHGTRARRMKTKSMASGSRHALCALIVFFSSVFLTSSQVTLTPTSTATTPPNPTRLPLPSCAASLACTYEDIDRMSMPSRSVFLQTIQSTHGPAFDADDQWRNLEGVIDFFIDNNLGAPGSWISYIDAGVLEGIERGFAIASGLSTDTFGSPCAQLWSDFISDMGAGMSDFLALLRAPDPI